MPVATKKNTSAPSLRTNTVTDATTIATNDMTGREIVIDPNLIDFSLNSRAHKILPIDVKELAKKLRNDGQYQAVGVHKHPTKPGRWILEFGNRRTIAALVNRNGDESVGVKGDPKYTIRAFVFPAPTDTDDGKTHSLEGFTRTLNENRDRDEVTPVDDAHAAAMLRDEFGLDDNKEIANKLGTTAAWVGELFKISELDPKIKALITDGAMGAKEAVKTHGFTKAQVEAVVEAVKRTSAAVAKNLREIGTPPEKADVKAATAGKKAGKAAIATARAAGAGTPKSNKGRKATAGGRTVTDVRAAFNELQNRKEFNKDDFAFFTAVANFCNGKGHASNMQAAYYTARGLIAPVTSATPAKSVQA